MEASLKIHTTSNMSQQVDIINNEERISTLQVYKYTKNSCDSQVIAYAGDNRIHLHKYKLSFDEKHNSVCTLQSSIGKIDTVARTVAMDFAPLPLTDSQLLLVTADNKHGIHLHQKDVQHAVALPLLHKQPINQVIFVQQQEYGTRDLRVLTCSDDNTCKLIDIDNQSVVDTWHLDSAVTSIDSDRKEASTVLAAMETGYLEVKDLRGSREVIRLRTQVQKVNNKLASPVTQAQFHPSDDNRIGCVAGSQYFIWDRRNSSKPVVANVAHHVGGCFSFQWAPIIYNQSRTHSGSLFATSGYDQVKIWDASSDVCLKTIQHNVKVTGVSWIDQEFDRLAPSAQPLGCVVAADSKLSFFEVL